MPVTASRRSWQRYGGRRDRRPYALLAGTRATAKLIVESYAPQYASGVASVASPTLSESQLETLARHGGERTSGVGDVLYRVGDRRYPFIAIIAGEAAIQDANGHEIVRHRGSGFLGEMNLLTGQTVYLTAVVTQPMRYLAVDRDALRALLFEDEPLSDLLLSAFMARREALQQIHGVGIEVVGPHSSEATRRIVDFA